MITEIQNECEYDKHLRAYVSRELPRAIASDVRAHIADCDRCRDAVALLTTIDGELAAWRGASAPEPSLRGRIAAAVAAEPIAIKSVTPSKWRFTWKETLLSAAILFVLVSFILPVFMKAREKARQVSDRDLMVASAPPPQNTPSAGALGSTSPAQATVYGSVSQSSDASRATTVHVTSSSAPVQYADSSTVPTAVTADSTMPIPATNNYDAIPHQIIYTAQVDITVAKLNDSEQRLSQLVSFHRGYISGSNVDANNTDAPTGSWDVRVPVEQFEEFMRDITTLGKVNTVHRDSQDVTDDYYDLQAHLANKQIEEERLKEYMEHKTSRLSDILTLEQELSRVRGEIEEMQGRMRLMGHDAAMSTVTISLSEKKKAAATPAPCLIHLMGKSFMGGVGDIGEGVAEFAIWFASIVPNVLLAAVAIALGAWKWRKRIGHAVR